MKRKDIFWKIEGEHLHIHSFEIPQPRDYEVHDNFPNCCDFHRSVFEDAKKWLKRLSLT